MWSTLSWGADDRKWSDSSYISIIHSTSRWWHGGAESLISLKGAFGIRAGSIPKTWKLIHNWFFTVNNWFHIMTPKPKTAKENQFLIPRSRSRPSSRTFVLLSLSLTLPNTNAQLCHHHWVWEAFMILYVEEVSDPEVIWLRNRQT